MITDMRGMVDAIDHITKAIESIAIRACVIGESEKWIAINGGTQGAIEKLESARADLAAVITAARKGGAG